MKKILFVALVVCGLTACKNALDRPYSEETLMEDIEVLVARDQINEEELQQLSLYLMTAEDSINLEGKTYRELLEEAKK